VTAAVALALASEAAAGCFATLGMSLPPRDADPGTTWTARLQVMQHGVRPVPGARPTVTIENRSTGERRTFRARPAGGPGRYVAAVVFPARGAWRLSGNDGFDAADGSWRCSQNHSFGTVAIGVPSTAPPAPPAAPGEAPVVARDEAGGALGLWLAVAGVAFAVVALGLSAALGRPRRGVVRA
jgi:hypothetical protein